MKVAIGDEIRADGGGGLFYNGTVHSLAFGKIRVKLPGGQFVEVDQRGDHKINGKKRPEPEVVIQKLEELDEAENLSEWEVEFVGDLLTQYALGKKEFSPKQEEMVERIYNRRVTDA